MSNNAPNYENNLVFPPQEIKSQHELRELQQRQSEVLIKVIEKCEELEKENYKLKQAINELGGIKCRKCGEYHNKHYICWNCGYDYTAPKELDK